MPYKWRNHQSFAWKVSRPRYFSKRRLQLATKIMRFNTSRLFSLGLRELQGLCWCSSVNSRTQREDSCRYRRNEPQMCENEMDNFFKGAWSCKVAVEAIWMILFFIINGNPSTMEWNKNQMIFHKKYAFFLWIKMKPLIGKPFI